MKKHLVIVESPSKSKTIEKYLGKNTELFPAKAMYVIWRQAEKKV